MNITDITFFKKTVNKLIKQNDEIDTNQRVIRLPESQTSYILKQFKKHHKLTNTQLNRICFRYSARIHDLRNEGHDILAVHIKGSLWEFIYKGEI